MNLLVKVAFRNADSVNFVPTVQRSCAVANVLHPSHPKRPDWWICNTIKRVGGPSEDVYLVKDVHTRRGNSEPTAEHDGVCDEVVWPLHFGADRQCTCAHTQHHRTVSSRP